MIGGQFLLYVSKKLLRRVVKVANNSVTKSPVVVLLLIKKCQENL